jgi:bacteriocin-like protein
MSLDMNNKAKKANNQSSKNIDHVIDGKVENAETRKELSKNDLDEVNGGIRFGNTGCEGF